MESENTDVSKCEGGAKAIICKENGGEQVHLDDHMKALCDSIQFDPQTFTIEDVQYDGAVIDDNLGGGRKALDTEYCPFPSLK